MRLGGTVLNLKLDYQWKPEICQKCNLFGHICKNKENTPAQVDKGKAVIQDAQSDSEGYTLVHRKQNPNAGIIILNGDNPQKQMDRAVALATAPANQTPLAPIQEPSKDSTASNGGEDKSYEADVSNPAQRIQDANLIHAESKEEELESDEGIGFEGDGASPEQNTQFQRNGHLVESQKTTEIVPETQITPSQGDIQLDSSFNQVIAALPCEQLAKLSAKKAKRKSKEEKQTNGAAQSSSRRKRR